MPTYTCSVRIRAPKAQQLYVSIKSQDVFRPPTINSEVVTHRIIQYLRYRLVEVYRPKLSSLSNVYAVSLDRPWSLPHTCFMIPCQPVIECVLIHFDFFRQTCLSLHFLGIWVLMTQHFCRTKKTTNAQVFGRDS